MNYLKKACLGCILFFTLLTSRTATFAQGKNAPSTDGRTVISLNSKWQFIADSAITTFNKLSKVKAWENVSLPHTWNATDVMDDEKVYYRGIGWYKKVFSINQPVKGKELFLYFDGINQQAEVYINGQKAGSHNGGYTRFCIPVSGLLNPDTTNEIVIKVDNRYNENIPPLTADFTFFGGIYRNVYLIATSPVHFSIADNACNGVQITTPLVSNEKALVAVKSQVTNSSTHTQTVNLVTTIYDSEGLKITEIKTNVKLKAGSTAAVLQNAKAIVRPHLWSTENPYLYRAISKIENTKTGDVTDQVSNPLGLRWFSFDADKGFFLNGKSCKLMGASRHQDFKDMGNALTDELHIQDIKLLKEMGGNYLRVAHYPQDPTVLEMCDKLGIITSVEIPVINTITESEAFANSCRHMLVEMIRQNFNHPSVVMWAYMNEILLKPKYRGDKTRQEQYFSHVTALAKSLDSICRSEDPYRYTMMANHGDFNLYNRTGLTNIPMVIGWNLYNGWYGNGIEGFGKFLDQHHQQLPQKPVLVTEYGADADERIHALNPVRFDKSVEYAARYHEVYLDEIQKRPFVAGAAAWNLVDFSSESREETMPHVNNKGLLTNARQPKATYFLYQANLLKRPFIKIAPQGLRAGISTTSDDSICTQPLTIYSNLSNVSLLVNGAAVNNVMVHHNTYTFQVPFVNGNNTIEAMASATGHIYKDYTDVKFELHKPDLKQRNFESINVLLGASRFYIDELNSLVWLPDQAYKKGSWGYVGGAPFKMSNGRQSYGSDKAIAGTDNDPVYQTQQVGIEQYQLDVPDGEYELALHFAELAGGKAKDLPYNLSESAEGLQFKERVFDVYVNSHLMLKDFNIASQYGFAWAVDKKMPITVTGGQGINITFKAKKGEPVLNALQLRRVY